MGYLDIQKIIQNNPALKAALNEDKNSKTDSAKSDDTIINTPNKHLNTNDEWEKAEAKPQTPDNTSISGGGGATLILI